MGGGSDLRYFYEKNLASSIGFPINKYCYVNISDFYSKGINLVSERENYFTNDPKSISNVLLRAILTEFKVNNKKINIFNDIPFGNGLGSSSSLTVCLTKAFSFLNKMPLNKNKIAEKAFLIEEKISGSTIGKQDHYMSTYGSINKFSYGNKKTIVKSLKFSHEEIDEIQKNFLLIKVGNERKAYDILYDQKNNLVSEQKKIQNMSDIVSMVPLVEKALLKFDFKKIGSYLKESWELKKSFSNKISNQKVDDLYNYLCDLGIYGGKLLGAGGSGFFMAISNPTVKKKIYEKINYSKLLEIKIDMNGCKIIKND
jgi:D-glycero-alpha-D-manno-heptose-7-phosphate kinase